MLAELHGKIDVAVDRHEDTLTAGVFGTLRYLPDAIPPVLRAMVPDVAAAAGDAADADLVLWPTLAGGTEPDVLIVAGGWLVVVEAKLWADFGAGDPPQLVREWRDARAWAAARGLRGPVVVAVTPHAVCPPEVAQARTALAGPEFTDALTTASVTADDAVVWAAWSRIAAVFDDLREDADGGELALLHDALALLDRRGVRPMFTGFRPEDYWIVTAAQRVAADRVYPAIANFGQQLLTALSGDGIGWGQSSMGVWNFASLALSQPNDWNRDYIMLPFWPADWPQRSGQLRAWQFVIFNFLHPRVEIGYVQQPGTVAAANKHWLPRIDRLCSELNALPGGWELAVSTGSYATLAGHRPTAQVDAAWLSDLVRRPSAQIRLQQRFAIDEIDVEQARDVLLANRDAVTAIPTLFELLHASGFADERGDVGVLPNTADEDIQA